MGNKIEGENEKETIKNEQIDKTGAPISNTLNQKNEEFNKAINNDVSKKVITPIKSQENKVEDHILLKENEKTALFNKENEKDNIEKNITVILEPKKESNQLKEVNKKIKKQADEPFIHKFTKNDTDIGYEDEIHRNLNFGRPIRLFGKIWLTYDFKVIPDTICPKLSINFMPQGWRLPSVKDLEELKTITKLEGFHHLTKKLKMNTSSIYVTSIKSFPDKVIGNDEESWCYKTILIGDQDYKITDTNLFKFKDNLSCRLIANELIEQLEFDSPIVAIVNKEVQFKIPNLCNITTFEWDFDDGIFSKSNIFKHTFVNVREHDVVLNLTLYGNRVFRLEKKIWVVNDFKYGEDEVINEIDYGPPVLIGQQVWMRYDMVKYLNFQKRFVSLVRGWGPGVNGENSYIDSVACCPNGWRLPTKSDIEELLKYGGKNDMQRVQFLLMKEGFGAKLNDNGLCHYICFDLIDDLYLSKQKYQKNDVPYLNDNNNNISIPNMINYKDLNMNNLDKHLNNKDFFNNIKYYDDKIISSFNYYDITKKSAYCLEINTNKAFISNRSTSLSSLTSFFSTRLIASDNFDLDIGIPQKDPVIYEYIQFQINHPNLISCEWDFGDNTKLIINDPKPRHKYEKEGKYEINVKLVFFGNREIKLQKEIYIQGFVSKSTTFFNEEQIFTEKLDYANCQRIDALHFTLASSTLVPTKDGGMYLVYYDILDFKLKIVKINIRPSFEVKDYVFQQDYLNHFDAIATEHGICLLVTDIRDRDLLLLLHINGKGEVLFRNIIMQNGSLPINAFKDQIMFFDPSTKKPYFGMNAMHMPKSGKLSYGKGKILVIFSYYNYFGYSREGAREDNNGDSIIVFDEDGKDVHLASIWSTSHSLRVNTCYDGRYFYTASLGDALPHNIKVVRVDPTIQNVIDNYNNKRKVRINDKAEKYLDKEQTVEDSNYKKFSIIHGLHNHQRNRKISNTNEASGQKSSFNNQEQPFIDFDLIKPDLKYSNNEDDNNYIYEANSYIQNDTISTNMVDGCIPGDMMGQSSGRLGSLVYLEGNNIALTYSRISCTNQYGESNKKNEFGAIIFNSDLIPMKKIVFFESDDVNCIKSTRYGNNMFVMFSVCERRFGQFLSDYTTTNDKTYAFLVDSEGKMVSDCIEIKKCKFNPNDELVTLREGSIAWTHIDESNKIRINVLYVEEKKPRFSQGQGDGSKVGYKLKIKEAKNADESTYKKPNNNIIELKVDNTKKYSCYVEKPLKSNIGNEAKLSIKQLEEKLKILDKNQKSEFEVKDIFKVKEKNYDDILIEGRTFNMNNEKKNYFKSVERKHDFLNKESIGKNKEKINDDKNDKNDMVLENNKGKKNYFKSRKRDYKFLNKSGKSESSS